MTRIFALLVAADLKSPRARLDPITLCARWMLFNSVTLIGAAMTGMTGPPELGGVLASVALFCNAAVSV